MEKFYSEIQSKGSFFFGFKAEEKELQEVLELWVNFAGKFEEFPRIFPRLEGKAIPEKAARLFQYGRHIQQAAIIEDKTYAGGFDPPDTKVVLKDDMIVFEYKGTWTRGREVWLRVQILDSGYEIHCSVDSGTGQWSGVLQAWALLAKVPVVFAIKCPFCGAQKCKHFQGKARFSDELIFLDRERRYGE